MNEQRRNPRAIDVAVVGGGPAGLSAALVLGRSRRPTMVFDAGAPRNEKVTESHGFLTNDGVAPAELRARGRAECRRYPDVTLLDMTVTAIVPELGEFEVHFGDGRRVSARAVLLAIGVVDVLPPIDGLSEVWGRKAFSCPYCHGWEHRDGTVAVVGADTHASHLAAYLAGRTQDVVLFTNHRDAVPSRAVPICGADVVETPIRSVMLTDAGLRLVLDDSTQRDVSALFLHPEVRVTPELGERLACRRLDDGMIEIDELYQTSVGRVFAAGDCARRPDALLPNGHLVSAVAAGSAAAIALDQLLFLDDLAAVAAHAGSSSTSNRTV